HIARRADPVVVPGPAADPDVLGHGDLDVVHVTAVPDRLVHGVREPQRQNVLDGLLAQVIVDEGHRIRAEHPVHHIIHPNHARPHVFFSPPPPATAPSPAPPPAPNTPLTPPAAPPPREKTPAAPTGKPRSSRRYPAPHPAAPPSRRGGRTPRRRRTPRARTGSPRPAAATPCH